jgi:hypothetical protein
LGDTILRILGWNHLGTWYDTWDTEIIKHSMGAHGIQGTGQESFGVMVLVILRQYNIPWAHGTQYTGIESLGDMPAGIQRQYRIIYLGHMVFRILG